MIPKGHIRIKARNDGNCFFHAVKISCRDFIPTLNFHNWFELFKDDEIFKAVCEDAKVPHFSENDFWFWCSNNWRINEDVVSTIRSIAIIKLCELYNFSLHIHKEGIKTIRKIELDNYQKPPIPIHIINNKQETHFDALVPFCNLETKLQTEAERVAFDSAKRYQLLREKLLKAYNFFLAKFNLLNIDIKSPPFSNDGDKTLMVLASSKAVLCNIFCV